MQNINFLTNGFEFKTSANSKYFIAYNAIATIDDVKIIATAVNYNYEYVKKQAYLPIILTNGKCLKISFDSSCRYFRRFNNDIVGWKYLRMLLLGKLKNNCDKNAQQWLKDKTLDMYEAVSELKEFRSNLIERLNK